jgi:hypothetical protein
MRLKRKEGNPHRRQVKEALILGVIPHTKAALSPTQATLIVAACLLIPFRFS